MIVIRNFKKLNIADWFSLYRVIASPMLLIFIWLDQRQLFTWLLLFSYVTDMVDGILARRMKIVSSRGSQIDSLGDQLTFGVALIGLVFFEMAFMKEHVLVITTVVLLYGIQMLMAYWKYGKATSFHTYLAKVSAILQGVFILWLLFFEPVYVLFYIMIIVGVVETIEEIILIQMYDHWVADVKGIPWALKDKRRSH